MINILTKVTNEGVESYALFPWHPGMGSTPIIKYSNVVQVVADPEGVEYLRQRFTGLPLPINRSGFEAAEDVDTNFFGDHAKFIAANLPWK